jgi:hypothetical protein
VNICTPGEWANHYTTEASVIYLKNMYLPVKPAGHLQV